MSLCDSDDIIVIVITHLQDTSICDLYDIIVILAHIFVWWKDVFLWSVTGKDGCGQSQVKMDDRERKRESRCVCQCVCVPVCCDVFKSGEACKKIIT